jgi:hypothetical protein
MHACTRAHACIQVSTEASSGFCFAAVPGHCMVGLRITRCTEPAARLRIRLGLGAGRRRRRPPRVRHDCVLRPWWCDELAGRGRWTPCQATQWAGGPSDRARLLHGCAWGPAAAAEDGQGISGRGLVDPERDLELGACVEHGGFTALGLAGWIQDLYFSLGFGGGMASQGEDLAATLVDRAQPKKTELESEMVMQRCYECADGRWMIIMMPFREEYYWPRFTQALGCPEWAEAGHAYADRAQRYRNRRDLGKQIAAIITQGGSTDLPIPHLWQITTLSRARVLQLGLPESRRRHPPCPHRWIFSYPPRPSELTRV